MSSLMFMTFFFFMMSGGSPPMGMDEIEQKRRYSLMTDSIRLSVHSLTQRRQQGTTWITLGTLLASFSYI
jgi:hypothetical protein